MPRCGCYEVQLPPKCILHLAAASKPSCTATGAPRAALRCSTPANAQPQLHFSSFASARPLVAATGCAPGASCPPMPKRPVLRPARCHAACHALRCNNHPVHPAWHAAQLLTMRRRWLSLDWNSLVEAKNTSLASFCGCTSSSMQHAGGVSAGFPMPRAATCVMDLPCTGPRMRDPPRHACHDAMRCCR